ncbi:hypothetical protein D3C86_2049370 [compost metagenome]
MCEFAIADIDADMRNPVTARIEEYEIARAKVVFIDGRAHFGLGTRRALERDAELFEHVLCKA